MKPSYNYKLKDANDPQSRCNRSDYTVGYYDENGVEHDVWLGPFSNSAEANKNARELQAIYPKLKYFVRQPKVW